MGDKPGSVNDTHLKYGIGATALGTLAGLGAPLFGWWIGGTLMLFCAAVAAWAFAPLVWGAGSFSQWVTFTEAARLLYARASPELRQRIDAEASDPVAWGRERLQVWAAAGEIVIEGRRGHGTAHESIPAHMVEELRLDVVSDDLSNPHGGPSFSDLRVRRGDVKKVIEGARLH